MGTPIKTMMWWKNLLSSVILLSKSKAGSPYSIIKEMKRDVLVSIDRRNLFEIIVEFLDIKIFSQATQHKELFWSANIAMNILREVAIEVDYDLLSEFEEKISRSTCEGTVYFKDLVPCIRDLKYCQELTDNFFTAHPGVKK